MREDEAVEAATTMLHEGASPQAVTALLVLLEPHIEGPRSAHDKDWWARMTSPTSPRFSTHRRT